jgi:hypothetical protein
MKNFDQYFENFEEQDDSLNQLVRSILSACKMDVREVEESDPEFIPDIANMIKEWHFYECRK